MVSPGLGRRDGCRRSRSDASRRSSAMCRPTGRWACAETWSPTRWCSTLSPPGTRWSRCAFPAVVEERAVVDELLAPNEEHFVTLLENLEGRSQFTLTGRYEQDAVLREVLESDEEIRALREKVRELPEDASYYDRVRLGELIVQALEQRRGVEGAGIIETLEPFAGATVPNQLGTPEDVVNAAFLVERERQEEFENAVEGVGEELAGRVRLRLLGPVAPYDFTPED